MSAIILIAIRLPSAANLREHWSKRAKRAKAHRKDAWLHTMAAVRGPMLGRIHEHGAVIEMTRIAPRALDSDNLASAFKALRDGVADALGIDDGDARLEWRYSQRKGAARHKVGGVTVPAEWGVEIQIEARAAKDVCYISAKYNRPSPCGEPMDEREQAAARN